MLAPVHRRLLSVWMALLPAVGMADDWPQWMGEQRDGVYRETGIVDRIPEQGLPVLWRVPIAAGYSGPAVAAGKVFVTDYVTTGGKSTNNPGGRDKLTGQERVHCFDARSGAELWMHAYERPYDLSYANGPRATPTVDGDRVYTLGAEGDLICWNVDSGEIRWQKQLAEEFQAPSPIWGHAAHPLIHGDLLYCLAGGKGSVAVALDKLTGEVRWQALSAAEMGYCPPSLHTWGDQQQLLIWHGESINALDPLTGQLKWTYPLQPRYGMAIAAPQSHGQRLFASGIGETAVMLEMQADGTPGAPLWTGKPKMGLYSGNATALFDGDTLYGSDCGSGMFIAINAADGARHWETFALTTGGDRRASHGTAFVVKHQDKFLVFAETGELIFAKFSPAGFEEQGRMQLLEPTSDGSGRPVVWSHPAFANRCVYARNDQELVCVSLAAE